MIKSRGKRIGLRWHWMNLEQTQPKINKSKTLVVYYIFLQSKHTLQSKKNLTDHHHIGPICWSITIIHTIMHVYVPNLFRTFTRRSLQQTLSEHRHWAISQTTSPHNFADTRHSWRDGGIVSRRCQISVTGSHLVSLIEMVSTDLSSFNQSVSPIIVYRLYVLFRPHAVMWLVSAMSGASQRPQLRGGAEFERGRKRVDFWIIFFKSAVQCYATATGRRRKYAEEPQIY